MSEDPNDIRARAMRELDRQDWADTRRLYKRLARHITLLIAIIAAWIVILHYASS